MRRWWQYFVLYRWLDIEAVLWTLIDIARHFRSKHAEKMQREGALTKEIANENDHGKR